MFKIIKLNTMYRNSDGGEKIVFLPMMTPVSFPFAVFSEKPKLMNCPSSWNILQGSMSIVGARPQMLVDFYKYPPEVQNASMTRIPVLRV